MYMCVCVYKTGVMDVILNAEDMYIYICTYRYICVCVHTGTYLNIYIYCMYICKYIFIYKCLCNIYIK